MTSPPDLLAPPDQTSGGLNLEIMAGLSASLGQIQQDVTYLRGRHGGLCQSIRYISHITAPTANASGIIKADDVLGPKTGQCWDIKRITAANFSGGTVSVYLDSHQAPQNQLVAFSQAGTYLFGKAQLLLGAGDQLVVNCASATGGTVFVSIGVIQIGAPWLADYLI